MSVAPLSEGPVPLYEQLKQRLRAEIARGAYRPGDRLPAEPELVHMYGVSRITVRQALSDLEAEGLIVRRHGKGTFVAERRIAQELVRLTDFVEDMEQAGLAPSSRVLAILRDAATPEVALALGLPAQAEVTRVDRLRLADDRPIAYDTTWLPLRFGALLDANDLISETIYHILETRYQIPIVSGVFTIGAAAATDEQARFLDEKSAAPLLVIERVSYTLGEQPVYLQRRYYRPSRVNYRVTLQRQGSALGERNALRELRPIFREAPHTSTPPPNHVEGE